MSLLFERMSLGLHGSFGSDEGTHRAGFVSQNFVKLMCSYCSVQGTSTQHACSLW